MTHHMLVAWKPKGGDNFTGACWDQLHLIEAGTMVDCLASVTLSVGE